MYVQILARGCTSGLVGGEGTFGLQWEVLTGKGDPVAWALSKGKSQQRPPGYFGYSDLGTHLVAAVLHRALQSHPATKGQSILDYARTKLFDPLGITTRPEVQATRFSDTDPKFAGNGFGWAGSTASSLEGSGCGSPPLAWPSSVSSTSTVACGKGNGSCRRAGWPKPRH